MKKKKQKPKINTLRIRVLQNGEIISSVAKILKGNGEIFLSAHPHRGIHLPHFNFVRDIPLFKIVKGNLKISLDETSDGFYTSKGDIQEFRGTILANKEENALAVGDYGTIALGDLRIVFKVTAEPLHEKIKDRVPLTLKRYRRSLFATFFETTLEIKVGLASLAICLFLWGSVVGGLWVRPDNRPKMMEELSEEYILPFIAEKHLMTAPEALQGNLDRKYFIKSTMSFYKSFTQMVLGFPITEKKYMFPSSIERFSELYQKRNDEIEKLSEEEKHVLDKTREVEALSVLAIPAVMGDSFEGNLRLLVDKIQLLHGSLDANLEKRRKITTRFKEDPEYDYKDYKKPQKYNEEKMEYLSKINVWEGSTDENLMYEQGKKYSIQANQMREKMHLTKNDASLLKNLRTPILLPELSSQINFLAEANWEELDKKFKYLQASLYGAPDPKKIKEPLTGIIDKDLIEKTVQKNKFELQICYELALRRNEKTEGEMEWKWRIDSRGKISELSITKSNILDQEMRSCIQEKIASWKFPRPRKGSVEISYPFQFRPAKG